MNDARSQLKGCPCCGLVQSLPAVPAAHEARCARCGTVLHRTATGPANRMAAAAALAALILYPLGVSLPVLRLEELGHVKETSIWAGTISLLSHGQIIVGLIVFFCSIVIPLVKLAALFMLTAPTPWLHRHHQASVYHAIEWAGRWGMIDVLLVAILVAALKLGDLVAVHPGPGLVAFSGCVLLSLVATAFFNPHAIWERTA